MNLEKWFFGFFVKQYKVSLLITFLLIFYWFFSLLSIPKESSPDIKFGIIWINTIYTWVNPQDIDDLITDKIEKEIKDIEWIKKISSTSSLWISSITVELQTWVDTKNLLIDIKDKVDKISLPTDAEEPNVSELSSNNELLTWLYVFWKKEDITKEELYDKSLELKEKLEWKNNITDVKITPNPEYEILISLDKTKIENLWISMNAISQVIRNYNKNTPIWSYSLWDLQYDYRIIWERISLEDIKKIPVISSIWQTITLQDIAEIKRDYKSKDIINEVWFYEKSGYFYVNLTVNKKPKVSIFNTADTFKKNLEEIFKSQNFIDLKYEYVNDLSSEIIKDYKDLAKNWITTLVLVFIMLFIFLWFKEAIIATLLVPLAFFITFIVLYQFGFSLNFLTNFSLLLTLWIALDTIIVVVEWASDKTKIWYSPKIRVLLAIKEYHKPLIAWTATTLVVFLPMMFLPWIMWKFLSYIPITIFITLLWGLVLSLTLNSALFMKLFKDKKYFIPNKTLEEVFSEEERKTLEEERLKKIEKTYSSGWFRYKFFWFLENSYSNILKNNIEKKLFRIAVIFIPLILTILSLKFISPQLWFTLFPASDNTKVDITIETKVWANTDYSKKYLQDIINEISTVKEIKIWSVKIENNTIDIWIELFAKDYRDANWLKNSFEVEKEINQKLSKFEALWLKVETKVEKWWPPWSLPIWIKLEALNNTYFDDLVKVSKDFEVFLKWISWTKNVSTTSKDTPGQFVFKINEEKIASLWLTPNDILSEIFFMSSWINAWVIKWDYDDIDVKVKISDFENNKLTPDDILWLSIKTSIWKISMKDILKYEALPAISSISREDWKIVIKVESDLENQKDTPTIQKTFQDFASKYNFPTWISFASWWENEENKDLIVSTMVSFIIAIFLIFTILVLQFNSYLQPAIILYSIVLALLWVNIWLYITWNPYSMPFAIWFIALTWIVVNNAIILIDKININLEKWMDKIEAVRESGKSRLRPILLTTLTTVFWILPLAMQDEFWAWLWYTIVFGLTFATFLTLFVTPSLYYSLFLKEKKKGIFRRILWKIKRPK